MAEQALFAALNRFPISWKKRSGEKSRLTFQIEFGFSISFGGNLMTILNADSEQMTNKRTILKCQTSCASSRGRLPANFQLAHSDIYYFKPRNSRMFRYVHCKVVQGNGPPLKAGASCPRKSFILPNPPLLLTLISFSF
jgi:hypothetical protein